MANKNYYDVLGVSKTADKNEIKRSFRKLAMQYHPDRNKDPSAEDKFKEINEAYEVLSDDQKRSNFDQYGSAEGPSGFGGGGGFEGFSGFSSGGFADIFSDFFGGGASRSNAPRQGASYQDQVIIKFEDSFFGIKISRKLTKVSDNGKQEVKDVEIKIPEGIRDGQTIRLDGYGGPGQNGGPNGDLLLIVRVSGHKHFIRQNDDIYLDMPISVIDIINESEIEIPTMNGKVKHKLRSSYSTDEVIKFSDYGFSSLRYQSKGDLFVTLKLYVPKLNSKQTKEIISVTSDIKDYKKEKFIKNFK